MERGEQRILPLMGSVRGDVHDGRGRGVELLLLEADCHGRVEAAATMARRLIRSGCGFVGAWSRRSDAAPLRACARRDSKLIHVGKSALGEADT